MSSNQKNAFIPNARSVDEKKPKLILVTTVGLTLRSFFHGQITYLKNKGFEVIAVSSGGHDLEEFARKEELPVHAITMTRGISPFADLVAVIRLWMLFLKNQARHSSRPYSEGRSTEHGRCDLCQGARKILHFAWHYGGNTRRIRGSLLKLMEWTACALADRVLAVSRSVMDGVVFQRLCSDAENRGS